MARHGEFSLVGFAAHLLVIDEEIRIAAHHGLEKACEILKREIQDEIGVYQPAWPQLALRTQDKREALGYSPNEPLLMSGELRDSIEYSVGSNEATVGTNDDIAIYQELGTSDIPPRSFLMTAAVNVEKEVQEAIGREIEMALFLMP